MLVRFLLSTLTDFPTLKSPQGILLPEVALIGRSNVGKSSLINYLFNQKNIAKTSSSPGKTRLLNFFSVEDRYLLVDLPGYGFAKASEREMENWSKAVDHYLSTRTTLRLLLFLIDSRRGPNQEDDVMIAWAKEKKIPLLWIFTKTDKLSRVEKGKLQQMYPEAIVSTVKEPDGRRNIQQKIEKILGF